MMQRLILAGGGHAHLAVLRALAHRPPQDAEVVLVTPSAHTIYSGMMPGWIAGHYERAAVQIDLRPLAAAARVRLVIAQLAGMNAQRRCVALSDGRQMEYDTLSLDVGSESDLSYLEAAGDALLPVRPWETFMQRWPEVLQTAARRRDFRLIVVGGGASGVELAFATRHAFARHATAASVTLIASSRGLLPGHAPRAAATARRLLEQHGIAVYQATAAGAAGAVLLSTGELLEADCIVAATGGRAPNWLRVSRLALDRGHVCVDAAHRSISHPEVFAAGDVCSRVDTPVPRSGVHAVRAGDVLGVNLLRALRLQPLRSYRPRRRTLYLISTGSQHAIASWGRRSVAGSWVWHLKRWIDLRYVSGFLRTPAVVPAAAAEQGQAACAAHHDPHAQLAAPGCKSAMLPPRGCCPANDTCGEELSR